MQLNAEVSTDGFTMDSDGTAPIGSARLEGRPHRGFVCCESENGKVNMFSRKLDGASSAVKSSNSLFF